MTGITNESLPNTGLGMEREKKTLKLQLSQAIIIMAYHYGPFQLLFAIFYKKNGHSLRVVMVVMWGGKSVFFSPDKFSPEKKFNFNQYLTK